MAMPRVALVVTNDLSTDQRLHKVCVALAAGGYAPTLVGVQWADTPALAERPYPTRRVQMWARRGPLFYAEANVRLLGALLRLRPDVITANDLDTLLAARVAGLLLQRPVVYDAHEFYTEMGELRRRPLVRAVWRALEALLYPNLRHVMTVDVGIAALYLERYPHSAEATVVANLPLARPAPTPLPSADGRILLYQGAVQAGRGLELALEALALLPDARLWVVGDGYHRAALEQLAHQLGVNERVRWWGQLPFGELGAITPRASVGLSLETTLSANLAHSSPNKLYDYLQARLPVVVAPRPVHRRVVEQWACGRVLNEETADGLAVAIRELLDQPEAYAEAQAGAARAAEAFTWEGQARTLLGVYARALEQAQ